MYAELGRELGEELGRELGRELLVDLHPLWVLMHTAKFWRQTGKIMETTKRRRSQSWACL
jgi:hypothetical protein